MNNEPITITVGEYEIEISYSGDVYLGKGEPLAFCGNPDYGPVIAALARELAEARRDTERLTNLIAQGPPGAAINDMCLTAEAWDLGAGMVDGPDDTDQVVMRKAIDLFAPNAALSGSETQA